MTQTQQSYDGWVGRTAYDANGEKIGEITDIFYDDKTRRPEWVAIKTGLFKGTAFAPIQGSSLRDGDGDGDGGLQLAYDKAKIADAPHLTVSDDHMTPEEEADVWAYYGYDYGADTSARNTDFGYGQSYTQPRADKDFMHRRWNEQQKDWTDERKLEEHTEEVPVATTATVEVPVEAKVRLRRYNTTQQKTRTVEIPYEETTEHTEVASVDAHAAGGPKVTGQASVGKTTR